MAGNRGFFQANGATFAAARGEKFLDNFPIINLAMARAGLYNGREERVNEG
jgi:hypothetical protein